MANVAAWISSPRKDTSVWISLERASWWSLSAAVAFGVLGGALTSWTGIGGEFGDWTSSDYRPPLFFVIANGLYAVAILLALPALVRAIASLARGRVRHGTMQLYSFGAPIVVYLGFVFASHWIGCLQIQPICRDGSFTGVSHLFHHTIVAGLPLLLLAWVGKRGLRRLGREARTEGVGGTSWQQAADRVAGVGEQVLRMAVALAILGGIAYVFIEFPSRSDVAPVVDVCPNPPCFWDASAGLPSIADLGVVLPVLGMVLSMVLGGPSAVAGAWDAVRRRWRMGLGRMLPFFGPMLVLVGMEVVPHVLSPCLLVSVLGGEIRGLCKGEDLSDRWHALHHAAVGALPLVVLYSLLRRRPRVKR